MTHRTYQTRLQTLSAQDTAFLDQYASLFGRVERTLFAQSFAQGLKPSNEQKRTFLTRFGITGRQYNAVVYQLRGKVESIRELRKNHIADAKGRIEGAKKAVSALERRLNRETKTGAATRSKTAFKLHQKKRRLAILEAKQAALLADHQSNRVSLCFGSKRLFNAQHHLDRNGYSDHAAWRADWYASRNSQFVVLGSKDESAGCQGCQLRPTDTGYRLVLRLPNALVHDGVKTVSLSITLNYGESRILDALSTGVAITYRFKRDAKGWRVFISVPVSAAQTTTDARLGAIGVDLNADHLAVVETNRHGNPIAKLRVPLVTHGKTQEQRKAIIGDAVKQVLAFAADKHKPLVVERLDLQRKKTELETELNKRYARMLSALAYNQILQTLRARGVDTGIEVMEVNPAYSSVIGKHKFAQRYGLSTHHGAALAIARRAQRFSERPNRRDQNASWLPERKATEHVWSYWRKVAKKPLALEALHLLRKQSSIPQAIVSYCDREPTERSAMGVGA
ncbi:MAG: IS200/IS605 family accessory protein TnpB-related protein [Natronospirillum sp.]